MKVNINKVYKNKRKIDDERTQKCCYEIVLQVGTHSFLGLKKERVNVKMYEVKKFDSCVIFKNDI